MARTDLQVNFRIPRDVIDMVKEAAAKNGRSITSEVVTRLNQAAESRTLRDEIAMASLNGLLSAGDAESEVYATAASYAYAYADAMLAERAKGGA